MSAIRASVIQPGDHVAVRCVTRGVIFSVVQRIGERFTGETGEHIIIQTEAMVITPLLSDLLVTP